MVQHLLFSKEKNQPIVWFDKFDKEKIKLEVDKHLTQFPTDILELCKEYGKKDINRLYGYKIIKTYKK